MAFQADAPVRRETGHDPRVLVVYTNFAFGTAVFQRLVDHYGVVELARADGAARRLREHGRYEAVVLCPYLDEERRQALRALCSADPAAPAVLEVNDLEEGPRVTSTADGFEAIAEALASPYQLSGMDGTGRMAGGQAV